MANRVPQPTDDQLLRRSGRIYSRFGLQHHVYGVPVDWRVLRQKEHERIEELHRTLRDLFQGQVVLPPFPPATNDSNSNGAPKVLDCGCGQGAWIDGLIDDCSGECDGTGIDIYLGRAVDDDEDPEEDEDQPDAVQEWERKRWNLNARFSEDPRRHGLGPESFHLINSRLLAEGINASRWPSYVHDLCLMLKRGNGWLQMIEIEPRVQSWNGRLRMDSCLTRWWEWYVSTMTTMRKNPRIGQELRRLLEHEGLADVRGQPIDLPIGDWATGRTSIETDAVEKMLKSLSLYPFLHVGGMAENTYLQLMAGAIRELRTPDLKLYLKVHYAYGRRRRAG
ncbi:uncharacterized protein LTR77_010793 [Saxophila tyrrhenica]|uniref:Methyltransferase domain-containing protein n=1 Tax=Saxophila tyrrhenica TaxID=1690608 RepID=A0AAV9NU54_9PEZI|nr:hypothetical protein LTR77_010793 [Saxophila tyrrhenica]